jgi:heterodisulfide reductase subunit B
MHQVDCEPLLQKIGVQYDPSMKFKGLNGKNLGKPVLPACFKAAELEVIPG